MKKATATRAKDMTESEREFIGVPPWILVGPCKCGKPVTVRVYGLKAELQQITLRCEDCKR